jgi:toxin ParE1/3/4
VAEIIWTSRALASLGTIADFIALDNPDAAKRLVQRIIERVTNLSRFPLMGRSVPEAPHTSHRQLIIPPCRVFYRPEHGRIVVIFVMRGEQHFKRAFLEPTDR